MRFIEWLFEKPSRKGWFELTREINQYNEERSRRV